VTVRHSYLLFPQDQAMHRSSLLVKAVVGGDLAVEHARLQADKVTATPVTPSIVELQPAACHKNMLLRPSSILRWLVAEAVVEAEDIAELLHVDALDDLYIEKQPRR